MGLRREPRLSRRQQRGAAAVFAAIWMIAAIVCIGLVIDLGRLYLEHREMQRVANVAALDSARVASGCIVPVNDRLQAASTEAQASVLRNGGQSAWLSEGAVRVGQRRTGEDSLRRFVATPSEQAFAVEVALSQPMPSRIVPMFGGEAAGTLRVTAHAEQLPQARVHVGTFLASVSNPDIVGPMLCALMNCSGGLNISALGYQGLIDTNVPLVDLLPGPPVDETVPDFLDQPMTVPGLLQILADALRANGDPVVATTVETIAAASDTVQTVAPAEFFDLTEGMENALVGTTVNAWEFVLGTVEQAASGNPVVVNVDDALAQFGVPVQLGNNTVTLRVPNGDITQQGAAGFDESGNPRTAAFGAQVLAEFQLELPPILGQPVRLSLFTELARAQAELVDVRCASSRNDGHEVVVDARSGVSRIGIGTYSDIANGTSVDPVTVLEISLLGVPIQIQASAIADVGQAQYERLVFTEFGREHRERIGVSPSEAVEGALGSLVGNLQLTVTGVPGGLLGTQIQGLLQGVLAQLTPLLTGVLVGLDGVVVDSLGANLGGADVWVDEPVAEQPVLFTR